MAPDAVGMARVHPIGRRAGSCSPSSGGTLRGAPSPRDPADMPPYAHSIELRHLRYFAAVAEEHQFTRAAARLHLAQPPLSAQVRQLEERLGARLFDRAPGRVSLTPAGEALLEAVERTFAALDDGIRAVEAIAAGSRGRGRVALGPTVPVQPALDAIARTRTAAPELHVELA